MAARVHMKVYLSVIKRAALLAGMLLLTGSQQEQVCEVHISGIRNLKGNIVLSVFKDQGSFSEEKPYCEFIVSKASVKDGKLMTRIRLEEGTYGITLLDDEDCNGGMRYNLVGMPKEGFGFSNYVLTRKVKPRFRDFCFDLKNNDHCIRIEVTYF